jgi:hypothetical protein
MKTPSPFAVIVAPGIAACTSRVHAKQDAELTSRPAIMRRRGYLSLFAAAVTLIAAQGASGSGAMQTAPTDPEHILTERFQFSAEAVSQARSGQPIARMIAGRDRDELAVVGALRLDGDKKRLVDWVRNIEHFRHAAELGLTRAIESPPAAQSFAELVLDAKDLAALQACRPGRCDLRVPDEVMAKFQSGVAWGTPEASAKANALFAGMLTEYAAAYLHGGDAAVSNDFGDLLRSATTLYELAPDFTAYLQKFPGSKLAGVDQRFYWTNLTEASGSIISLHHLVVYRRPSGDVIIADKTFYASRYFDVAALVLSMQDTPDGKGYYLIAGSRARSSRLTGVTGRVLRGQVERAAAATVRMYLMWLRDSLAAR